jgi:hypothetical protein
VKKDSDREDTAMNHPQRMRGEDTRPYQEHQEFVPQITIRGPTASVAVFEQTRCHLHLRYGASERRNWMPA